jgi:hypothetical protein
LNTSESVVDKSIPAVYATTMADVRRPLADARGRRWNLRTRTILVAGLRVCDAQSVFDEMASRTSWRRMPMLPVVSRTCRHHPGTRGVRIKSQLGIPRQGKHNPYWLLGTTIVN